MNYTLGENVKAGQKILTNNGWEVIKEVTEKGVVITSCFIKFGETIYGWKSK